MVGATVMRDATGDVSDLLNVVNRSISSALNNTLNSSIEMASSNNENRTWSPYGTDFRCNATSCKYGSQNSFQVIIKLIYRHSFHAAHINY